MRLCAFFRSMSPSTYYPIVENQINVDFLKVLRILFFFWIEMLPVCIGFKYKSDCLFTSCAVQLNMLFKRPGELVTSTV